MAPKKKEATPAKVEEPPAKKAKTEEPPAKVEATEVKEEEKKEKEVDAPKDSREKFGKPITFEPNQTTLNVIPTLGGKVLMAATDGGAQYFIAGAKASAGMKAGRYMFEVQIIEALAAQNMKQRGQGIHVKVGLSTQESSLFLGDAGTVCFDADGGYTSECKRQITGVRFTKESVIGLVVNLDKKSPNFNTVSLFKNGVRAGEPMPLPEGMQGKPLFPSVNFRAVSLQVNFGPTPLATMPFTCTTLAGAAKADVVEVPSAKGGTCEVVFPVGKPDEGTFEFLDNWMEQNPGYVELSERKMQEWAVKSGMWKGKGSWKNCNDKPDWNFGVPAMDDKSVVRVMNNLAPLVPRNYIVMEVKQNLVQADRELNLKRFPDAKFTKTALVAMGDPDKEFKGKILKKVLENKQARMTLEWNRKKKEKATKKMAEKKKKEMEKMQKKVEAVKAKMEEDKKAKEAKAEEDKKAKEEPKEGEEKKDEAKEEPKEGESTEEKKDEPKEEDKKDEPMEEEKKEMEVDAEAKKEEDVKEEEEKDEAESEPEDWEKEAPVAELTEEEQAVSFKTPVVPDLSPQVLSLSFANFSIPEKSEGFKKVTFKWFEEKKAKEYLKSYILKTKLTARVEDLVPGEWFKTKAAEFEKSKKEYEEKLAEYTKNKGEKKEDEEKKDIELASIEDVNDVGSGEPLYSEFVYEDWALMALRYELYLMVVGFKKDVNDDERPGIHESHVGFYYAKYFRKQLNPKMYAKETLEGVIELVKDIIKIDPESKVLQTTMTEEPETAAVFVKQAEKHRRERQRRIQAGDDTAKLKFMQPQPAREWKRPEPAAAPAAGAPDAAGAPAAAAAPAAGKPAMPAQQHKQWANQDKQSWGNQGGNKQWGNQGGGGGQQWGNQGQQGGSWGKGAKGGGGGGGGGGKGWGKSAKGGGGGGKSWGK